LLGTSENRNVEANDTPWLYLKNIFTSDLEIGTT
jgi:hypothetical protein